VGDDFGGGGIRGCQRSQAVYEALGQLGQETSVRYRTVELSNGSNVIPRRARPGLAGLGPHTVTWATKRGCETTLAVAASEAASAASAVSTYADL